MIIDARTLPSGTSIPADLCIIGAGAGGISITLALAGAGLRIVVLEAGGRTYEAESQTLYEGESVGLAYDLATARTRCLGGSTNCWSGFSRPFEDHHFAPRSWVPNSGWPLSRAELDPYYDKAIELCGLDKASFDPLRNAALHGWVKPGSGALTDEPGLVTTIAQLNRTRRRFGRAHRKTLAGRPDVQVFLHANATRLNLADNAAEVASVSVASLTGVTFSVQSRSVVLAAGGIENPRLLLLSNDLQPAGLGNGHDVVGRYFMEHPTYTAAHLKLDDRTFPAHLYDTLYALRALTCSAEFNVAFARQAEERILDSTIYINAHYRGEESPGVDTLKTARKLAGRGMMPFVLRQGWPMLAHLPDVLSFGCGYLTRWPWLMEDHEIVVAMESAPNPDSRVLLSDERDRLGLNKVRLDWQLTELDQYSLVRTVAVVEEELRRRGIGRVGPLERPNPRPHVPDWIWHHMGTTRMHPDPRQGVVDRACRVHGIGNLYVVGSSVFPTAGNHAPTLTLIALAFRLAEHLKERFHQPQAAVIAPEPSAA